MLSSGMAGSGSHSRSNSLNRHTNVENSGGQNL